MKLYRVTVNWGERATMNKPGETHEYWVRAANGDDALKLARSQCLESHAGTWGFQNAEGNPPAPGLFRSHGISGWYTGSGDLDSVLRQHEEAWPGQPVGVLVSWEKPDMDFSRPRAVSMIQ